MPHQHTHCINGALHTAEKICSEKGLRLTPLRKQVLELVWADHKAVKAYDIIEKMSTHTHEVKPPIVYRTLDFLLENNFIHKLHSENAFIGCPHSESDDHKAIFVICKKCMTVEETLVPEAISSIEKNLRDKGYTQLQPHIEVSALCKNCA